MIEMFALIFLVRTLRSMLSAKGQSAWWAALGPVLWVSGEISGGIVGVIVDPDIGVTTIVLALGGALAGGALAFFAVSMLPVLDVAIGDGELRYVPDGAPRPGGSDGSPWQAPR